MSKRFISLLVLLLGLWSSCSQSDKSAVIAEETPEKENVIKPVSKIEPSVIYRSTDVGKTWVSYANGIPPEATVSSFLVDGDVIYASTDSDGIYRIKEGESKWLRMDTDLPVDIDINAITLINGTLIIATFKDGIYISHNEGRNWEPSKTSLSKTPMRSLLTYNKLVLAGSDNGIYKSTDFGATWQQVYKAVQTNGFTVLHNKIYAALMNGAIMTHDEGTTWNYIYKPHTLHDISNDGESIYAMTLGGGLLKTSNDGLTWTNVNGGMGAPRWYTFEVKSKDHQLFAAQWHGIYTSNGGDRNWHIIKNGLPDSTAFSTLEETSSGLIAGIGLRKR